MLKNLFYIPVLLFFLACGGEISSNKAYFGGSISDGITINAYFSQTSGNYRLGGGIDDLLIENINKADYEILLAIYALSNDRIRDALVSAYHRGIRVLVYTDEGEFFDEDIKVLKEAGIAVLSDEDPSALMHNKFMIIDKEIVWTGSCNYSYYAFYRNNENLVKIKGNKIAAVYREQFFELWEGKYIEKAYVSEVLEIYFSPEDDFEQRLLALIAQAKSEISFLAFAFTNKTIAEALIAKQHSGVRVRGVIDEKQNSYQSSSQYNYLKSQGIDVRLDGNKFTLHDKIMIIDETVITGSYNFTQKANDTNNENSIVVHNGKFKALYAEEFEKIYAQAKP